MHISSVHDLLTTLVKHRIELFLGLIILVLLVSLLFRKRNLPPGPIGLPIVGYLPFLEAEAYKTLHCLTGKYGPIFSFYLGSRLVVVLGNFKMVKEALTNSSIMDRPQYPANHLLPDSYSISVTSGYKWKEQRQFSVQVLRQLGMGKSEMESIMQLEMDRLIKEIDSRNGKPMNLDELILACVSNTMLALLTGNPLEFADKDRLFLNSVLQTVTAFFRPTRLHAYFPNLRPWMARLKIWEYDQVEYYMDRFAKYIMKEIEDHRSTLDHDTVRDYIDAYLIALKSEKDTKSSFSEKMLKGNFQSLFSAGSTPSRAAVEWTLLTMVLFPDVQKAVHEELDTVLGKDRRPKWADHVDLPYTLAVIYEVMRHNTVVPIAMLRRTSSRTKIGGYDIPKDTIVMPNIWGVHHDPECWDDPSAFRPERFIQDGKVIKPQEFIPFSLGKRNCPGEDMAIIEVFLFFTTLMQRYTITLPGKISDFKQIVGVAKIIILDNVYMKRRE